MLFRSNDTATTEIYTSPHTLSLHDALPLSSGPAWMSAVATVNPVNWVVQAERALLAGDFGALEVMWGALAALAVAIVGLALGIRTMRRSA